jgi:hypothetical protein
MKTSHKSDELKNLKKRGGPQIGYRYICGISLLKTATKKEKKRNAALQRIKDVF